MTTNIYQHLPTLFDMLSNPTRRAIGALGEQVTARLLEKSGYDVSYTHNEKRGDLRAVDLETGEILKVEVKTARRGKDKKWRFKLWKKGCTDHRDSDVVVLLAVQKTGEVIPFVIPTATIYDCKQIAITSDPKNYAGKYAQYRQSERSLKL